MLLKALGLSPVLARPVVAIPVGASLKQCRKFSCCCCVLSLSLFLSLSLALSNGRSGLSDCLTACVDLWFSRVKILLHLEVRERRGGGGGVGGLEIV